ncbi:MAG: YraN family protein [Candidatus Omnitrophota bacterium]|nr:YraN family protein [Candidatus Omnitrophota bacterium]
MGRGNGVVGNTGEIAALEFLKKKNYRILGTNARTPFGEIDIVAKKNGVTIFVEVKTRATSSLGPPYLSVTRAKEKHMIKNALCYLKRRKQVDSCWRIDVVSVKLNHEYQVENIELIENAVEDNG